MFDDLSTHFYEHVVRSLEDYIDVKNSGKAGRSRDIRAAVNAATPLYHLREHLPSAHALTWETVNRRCPDYSLLGDIANASKHSSLTRGNPQITNATQMFEQVVTTEYQDEHGPFYWDEKVVLVKLATGAERNVLDVLINVMNFWQNYLHSIGIISKPVIYSAPVIPEPRIRPNCAGGRLDFEIVQGLRFHQNMRLQRFNYTTGKVEPLDLKGAQLRFYLTKPVEMTLTLKNESLGKEFKKTITLTARENDELARLPNAQEKHSYLESLPSAQNALRELALEADLFSETPAA